MEYHRRNEFVLLNAFCTIEDDNGSSIDQAYSGMFIIKVIEKYNLQNYLSLGQNAKLSMLDLLLSMKLAGRIDKEGIQEEVDNFVFAVTRNKHFFSTTLNSRDFSNYKEPDFTMYISKS